MPSSSHDALLSLLHRAYEPILSTEEQMGIVVSASDFRARIEWFHDAVRAFSSNAVPLHAVGTRLSVEQLARDAQSLKAIQSHPMHPGLTTRRPTMQQLVPTGEGAPMHPSEAKQILMDAYKTYGVLFVALLAERADRNYQSRTDMKNAQVEEIGGLESSVKKQGTKDIDLEALVQQQVFDQDLKNMLLHRLNQAKKKKIPPREAMTLLKAAGKAIDASIIALDKAHFAYAAVQLTFLEQSKDVVKNLAMQGMNLAGKFLMDALGAATRGRGPGR